MRWFKTPISGKPVGHSIVGINPMAAKGFNRQSARAPSDHGPKQTAIIHPEWRTKCHNHLNLISSVLASSST
jgi:hypothetical protein